MKIAWIGTGVMGSPMALHLKNAGHDIHVYNRTYEKAKTLETVGLKACKTIAACVAECDVVFTMVGYPSDVADIYQSEDGIFHNAKAGAILVDMTTSSPKLAKALYEEAKQYQMHMLDAPVSGGDSGARDATLSIMVGGDEPIFQRIKPLFSSMGTNVHYMGSAGNGQHTKACNQIAVAGAVAAMSEAIIYAQNNGLQTESMLKAIAGGAAGSWQMNNTAPRVLKNDLAPGFYIKHFIKDMHIVQAEMKAKEMQLHMLDTVCAMYEKLAEQGEENLGTQALFHYYLHKNTNT